MENVLTQIARVLARVAVTEEEVAEDSVPASIEFARADTGEQAAIYLRPQRWLPTDLGPG